MPEIECKICGFRTMSSIEMCSHLNSKCRIKVLGFGVKRKNPEEEQRKSELEELDKDLIAINEKIKALKKPTPPTQALPAPAPVPKAMTLPPKEEDQDPNTFKVVEPERKGRWPFRRK